MNTVLTHRQKQVLALIRRNLKIEGAPPTIRELMEGLQLKSLRGVTIHLDALVRKGVIERSRQARGIKLLKAVKPEMAIYDLQEHFLLTARNMMPKGKTSSSVDLISLRVYSLHVAT